MYSLSDKKLESLGAAITTREIKQQPELWQEAFDNYTKNRTKITAFLEEMKASAQGKIRVIFVGAGTSQYVGDTIVPYLNRTGDHKHYVFESIGTTSIVASPRDYLNPDDTVLLVSFARSGNSPESVATVKIANKIVKNIYHLTITCAPDGKLAQDAKTDANDLLLLMPPKSNDAGFAMTGSYSCMALSALLIFDQTDQEKKASYLKSMIAMGHEVIEREDEIKKVVDHDFDRIVYLGSGSLMGLTREAQLKILELTAGKIATAYDSSMGFRHGPKSFVNDKTLVFGFSSNNPYTRQYDLDVLKEIAGDGIAAETLSISQKTKQTFAGDKIELAKGDTILPEGYLALPFVMVAQTVSLLTSVKVKNTPDTPSATGTVNRVVKGVIIHEY